MFFLLASVISVNAFSQQALWGTLPYVSPQINSDNTVTFRFFSTCARSVKITGDFLSAPADLKRDDKGLWQFTTDVLPSELYSYNFIVDSVKTTDPYNVYSVRDVVSLSNIFIVDGTPGNIYKVSEADHGTLSKVWYHSKLLNTNRRLTVYLPPSYYKNPKKKFPVLYLLHGMGGDENAWTELGRASQILDNLIAKSKSKEMIVVMTNGNVSQQAAPGETSEGFIQPSIQLPHTMDGLFEQSFNEVVDFVDNTFKTIADKHSRAIAGLSMGGFHSMFISLNNPDMFDYVGLFSAALVPGKEIQSPVYQDVDKKLKVQFSKQPTLYYIAIGKEDFLFNDNQNFRKKLDSYNLKYFYSESDDGHIWKNWRIYLTDFLPRLF